MCDAVIVDAVRTPSGGGKPGGACAGVHPVGPHAHVLRRLAERVPGLEPGACEAGGTANATILERVDR